MNGGFLLQSLINALNSGAPRVVESALGHAFKLFSLDFLCAEIQHHDPPFSLFHLIYSSCNCTSIRYEDVKLVILRLLLGTFCLSHIFISLVLYVSPKLAPISTSKGLNHKRPDDGSGREFGNQMVDGGDMDGFRGFIKRGGGWIFSMQRE